MAKPKNIVASVRQRLLNQSRENERPFMELLQYYAMEKFLLRMSRSEYAESFILKGALLLRVVGMNKVRPTKDIDLLGLTGEDMESLKTVVRNCCTLQIEDDGLVFHAETIQAIEIREDQAYQGVRITFKGNLGNAVIFMQIDIGFGDVVSPKPLLVEYPVLLEGESPKLLAYTLESAIAEKYQAMVNLDLANSRMKDFYDIGYLSTNYDFTGYKLAEAIEKTFARRKTDLPSEPPTALTDRFYTDPNKVKQWKAYHKKIEDSNCPENLEEVIKSISMFLWPINKLLIDELKNKLVWEPKKGWIA